MSQQTGYRPRRWPLWMFLGMIVAVVGFVVVVPFMRVGELADPTPQAYTPVPVPTMRSSNTPKPEPSAPGIQPETIRQAPATRIYVPNTRQQYVISSRIHRLPDCVPVIAPPLSGPTVGDVFSCGEYEQPGTEAPSLTVLAGHSSEQIPTAFNALYLQGERLLGQEVWVKTRASKQRWLVYRIDRIYQPDKAKLESNAEIWGTTRQETAGRLLLITCLQNGDGTPSTENFVAVASFSHVR